MKKLIHIAIAAIIYIITTASPGFTAEDPGSLDNCNSLYHNNSYEQAILCYQDLTSDGMSSPLFYNMGNSFAQNNQPGYAILYYLRALSLAPGDSDIAGNLALLRKEKGIFPPDPSPVQQLAGRLTISQWSILCLLALVIYLIYSLTRLRNNKNSRLVEICLIVLCSSLFIIGGFGAGIRYKEWHQSVAVIDSRLLVSPFENAASIGSIQQGRLVSPQKQHSDFWYVTDETGRKGWIQAQALEPILP